jgi:phage shock protein A
VAPPTPPAELRTPQTADTSNALKAVRTTIDTARGLLNGVNFGALSTERKKAYNDAKLLMQQAEDALKEGNLGIAQGVANKAETLARELAGR